MSTQKQTKLAVLYARTAVRPPQGNASPLVEQMKRLRKYARQQGCRIVAEHQEVGGGAVRNRT
jgi:hypothetical protein